MKKTVIVFFVVLGVVGCASRKTNKSTPTQATDSASAETKTPSHMDKVLASFPGYSIEQFNDGKTIYEKNCGSCHMLKDPLSQNEFAWNKIVPDMVKKANRKGAVIDTSQQELILKYVVSLSKNPN